MADDIKSWVLMGKTEDFPPGGKIQKNLEGETILILHQDDKWFAFEAKCPHQGRALDHSRVEGDILECIYHSIAFNMETGEIVDNSGYINIPKLKVYNIRVDEEGVWCRKPGI